MTGTMHVFDLFETLRVLGPTVIASLFCGGLIGLERELKGKAAGIKTNMIICVGAALFTGASMMIAGSDPAGKILGDPSRIAAQIVSGVGFLGGGAIIQSKASVSGLTTAATIWLVSAIGIWIGLGQIESGIVMTLVMLVVLIGVTVFEDRFMGRKHSFKLIVQLRERGDEITRNVIEEILSGLEMEVVDFREVPGSQQPELRVTVYGRKIDYIKSIVELWKVRGIVDIQQKSDV